MRSLELVIPPPVVLVLVGIAMWLIAPYTSRVEVADETRLWASGILAAVGIGIAGAAIVAFRIARTTINPMKPANSTTLIATGIYRLSRNPIYLGDIAVLVAWAVFLAAPWMLAGPVVFMAYTSRFQIAPEERALADRFGDTYALYVAQVRRWL